MKSREGLRRLRQFEVDEHRRKVLELETMIGEFQRMVRDLEQQIAAEEARAGVSDVSHFAYPPFAKAAVLRRDNLLESVGGLEAKLGDARVELEQAEQELQRVDQLDERSGSSGRGRGKAEHAPSDSDNPASRGF